MTEESPKPLPLQGILVVALEHAAAAPFATRQLADLGARVIKIERDVGDFARGYDAEVRGMSSYFVWLNRGKESVVLDLKSEQGARVLRAMIMEADVLVQNLAPGAVERLGLGPDAALKLNPRLVHVSISGYGPEGAYADHKAYDLLVQCESGLMSLTGSPEAPARVGVSIADISAGMYAFTGTLTALLQRERTGRGDVVEISMLEAMGEWVSQPYLFAEYGGASPTRQGARHASIAPYGPYAVRDGTVFVGLQNEREWHRFCVDVLEAPELATDPRFSSNPARVAHRDAMDAAITAALGPLSVAEAIARLDAAHIANARLRTMADLSAHPQLAERDRWRDVDTPVGPVRSLLPPVTARGTAVAMGPVPALGEHTVSVLAEFDGPGRPVRSADSPVAPRRQP